jgi:hypothetical protein
MRLLLISLLNRADSYNAKVCYYGAKEWGKEGKDIDSDFKRMSSTANRHTYLALEYMEKLAPLTMLLLYY